MDRNKYHDKLDSILNVFLKEEIQETKPQLFEDVTLKDGTIIQVEKLEIGALVTKNGNPLEDGEYIVSDTQTIVIKEGKIEEIKDAEAKPEVKPDEETKLAVDPAIGDLNAMLELLTDGIYKAYFVINEGKVAWEKIEPDAKEELPAEMALQMSNQQIEFDKQLNEIKLNFEKELKKLGQTIKLSTVIQAPVEKDNSKPLSKIEQIQFEIERQKKSRN